MCVVALCARARLLSNAMDTPRWWVAFNREGRDGALDGIGKGRGGRRGTGEAALGAAGAAARPSIACVRARLNSSSSPPRARRPDIINLRGLVLVFRGLLHNLKRETEKAGLWGEGRGKVVHALSSFFFSLGACTSARAYLLFWFS